MDYITTIETSVEFNSGCTYMINKETNIRRDIETHFLNRCFKSFYIIEILNITTGHAARIISTNTKATCILTVVFECLVKQYIKNGIVANVEICVSEGLRCGVNENLSVTFPQSTNNQILYQDQLVPVRIGDKVTYKPTAEKVAVLGSILLPLNETPVYKLTGLLKKPTFIPNYIEMIRQQNNLLQKDNTSKFRKLLNSYNDVDNTGTDILIEIAKTKTQNIDVTGYWKKNLKADCDKCLYIHSTSPPPDGEFIELSVHKAFEEFLKSCFSERQGLIDLTKIYSDEKLFNQAETIWTLMKKNKL